MKLSILETEEEEGNKVIKKKEGKIKLLK